MDMASSVVMVSATLTAVLNTNGTICTKIGESMGMNIDKFGGILIVVFMLIICLAGADL